MNIYIFPQGGLGNQLFQLCAGLSVQEEMGGTLYMLPIKYNKHSGRDYRKNPLLFTRIIPLETQEYTKLEGIEKYVQKDPFEEWTPKTFHQLSSIAIEGYFIFLPAISRAVDIVVNDLLMFLQTRRFCMQEKYPLPWKNTVFIHIRRNDYVSLKNLFGELGEKYYSASTGQFLDKESFIVISDDPEWCKLQSWLKNFQVIDEKDELDSLALMSLCEKGAIIANSTFSWWGAYLSKTKKVFYPSKWFLQSKPNIFPDTWIEIKVD